MSEPKARDHKINEHAVSEIDMAGLSLVDNASFHFGQSAEDISLLRFFYQKKDGFYVDIGAFHPTKYSNTYLLHNLYGWRGINIDASKEAIELFEKERPDDTNICAAIGNDRKTETLYEFSSSARNTLSKKNVERQNLKGDTEITRKTKVTLTPLRDVLSKNLPAGKSIDILDIDVEGYEMEVLKSNDWSKYRPRVVLIEDYDVGEGRLQESQLHSYLQDQDYLFFSHHFDTSFYIDKHQVGKDNLQNITRKEFINNLKSIVKLSGTETLFSQEMQSHVRRLEGQVSQLERQVANLERYKHQLSELYDSRSWRLTKPLRKIFEYLHKL